MSCNLYHCLSPLPMSSTWETGAPGAATRSCNELVSIRSCEPGSTYALAWWNGCACPLATSAYLVRWYLDLAPSQGRSERMWQKRCLASTPRLAHSCPMERAAGTGVVPARPNPSRVTPAWRPHTEWIIHRPQLPPYRGRRSDSDALSDSASRKGSLPSCRCAVSWQTPVSFLRTETGAFQGSNCQ